MTNASVEDNTAMEKKRQKKEHEFEKRPKYSARNENHKYARLHNAHQQDFRKKVLMTFFMLLIPHIFNFFFRVFRALALLAGGSYSLADLPLRQKKK